MLFLACIVCYMFDRSITNINIKDSNYGNCTALHYQALSVAWLLGQDTPPYINERDSDQRTPLMYAALYENSSMSSNSKVCLLVDHGADRDLEDYRRHTALDVARQDNKPAAIHLLKDYRPDFSTKKFYNI